MMEVSEVPAADEEQSHLSLPSIVSTDTNEIEPHAEKCMTSSPGAAKQSETMGVSEEPASNTDQVHLNLPNIDSNGTNDNVSHVGKRVTSPNADDHINRVAFNSTRAIDSHVDERTTFVVADERSKPAIGSENSELTSFGALALLQQYSESSGSDSSSDSSSEDEVHVVGQYRQPAAASSSSDSDNDSSSLSTLEPDRAGQSNLLADDEEEEEFSKTKPPRVYGELLLDDLPPIEDLTITVAETDCILLGKISSIVDTLVVIQAFPYTPALDVDTVLFLDQGHRTLGRVFDVFGQVTEPFYAVRFNSPEHIQQKGVALDLQVYCAPRTEHTSLVFVEELKKMKGSDASWKHDIEPPPEHIEYSDDEQERQARGEKRAKKRAQGDTEEPTQNEQELRNSNQRGNRPGMHQPGRRYIRPRGRGRGNSNVRPPPPAGHNPFYMRPPPFPNQQSYPFHPPPPQYSNWPPTYATPSPPGMYGPSTSTSYASPWGTPAPQFQAPPTNYNPHSNYNTVPGYSSYPPPTHPPS